MSSTCEEFCCLHAYFVICRCPLVSVSSLKFTHHFAYLLSTSCPVFLLTSLLLHFYSGTGSLLLQLRSQVVSWDFKIQALLPGQMVFFGYELSFVFARTTLSWIRLDESPTPPFGVIYFNRPFSEDLTGGAVSMGCSGDV